MVVRLKSGYNLVLDDQGFTKLTAYLASDANYVPSPLNQAEMFSRRPAQLFYVQKSDGNRDVVTRNGESALEIVMQIRIGSYVRPRQWYDLEKLEISAQAFFEFLAGVKKQHGV